MTDGSTQAAFGNLYSRFTPNGAGQTEGSRSVDEARDPGGPSREPGRHNSRPRSTGVRAAAHGNSKEPDAVLVVCVPLHPGCRASRVFWARNGAASASQR